MYVVILQNFDRFNLKSMVLEAKLMPTFNYSCCLTYADDSSKGSSHAPIELLFWVIVKNKILKTWLNVLIYCTLFDDKWSS